MAIVAKITSTAATIDGWHIVADGVRYHMSDDWFCRYRPITGDYLTHNDDGYYAVVTLHAYNAIRQFYCV